MKSLFVASLLVALSTCNPQVSAPPSGDNSVEVTLEDTPEQQQQNNDYRRWRFVPGNQQQDSDSQFAHWRYEFYAGSDKPLGTAADTTAIKALVSSTIPPTMRWISRSVVVVAADCYTAASSSGDRCLYVLEKHGSKWKLTHHYSHRLSLLFGLTNR